MKRTGVLEEIIEKYRLTSPLSSYDRRRIFKAKRKALSKIVKSEIYDSALVHAAVFFEHLLNRIGIKTTLAGGARAFAAASVIVFLVIVSSSLTVFYDYGTGRGPVTGIPEFRKGFILLAEGAVKITRNKREIAAVGTKERIITGDKIMTGPGGRLLFQMKKSLVSVESRSTASVEIGLKRKSLSLERGTLLCKVIPLETGEMFSVITPNAVAVVAGTGFGISYEKETTRVTVSQGAVKVTNLVKNYEIRVEKGQSAVIRGISTVKKPVKTGSREMQLLQKIGRLKYRENLSAIETNELREAVMAVMSEKTEKEKRSGITTLDDIRKKYGRLEEVRLYNGRVYTGAITSRGRFFTIITPGGVRRVRAKEVKNVRIIE